MPPKIIRKISDLRNEIASYKKASGTIGLIPTMGALHDGHLSLIRAAKKETDRQIVSIFVNPTQFGKKEDFAAYPRDEAQDAEQLKDIDILFAPSIEEMYPKNFDTKIEVGELGNYLCGPHRAGHFSGVATIVTKLLLQALPDAAYFGEKDYQQLQIIRKLVKDLDIPVKIKGAPTLREKDGLAMSSRNIYLSSDERQTAAHLPKVLQETLAQIKKGVPIDETLEQARQNLLSLGFGPIDYIELADSETLQPVKNLNRPSRLFAALYLGHTRLIDNWPL